MRWPEAEPDMWGRLFYSWFPIRRRVVLENMRRVFEGRIDARGLQRLAQRFYGHFCRSMFDMLRMIWMTDDELRRRMRIRGAEHLRRASEANRGVLILTGHFGSWEFAPVAAILGFQQYRGRFHFIRKTLGPVLERILFGRFARAGLGVIPKHGGSDQILDALSRNDAVAFLLDQHSSPGSKNGIAVEFFGRPAGTNRSLAMIAALTEAPVVPATSYREANGMHVMEFFPAVERIRCEDPEREIYENTRRYNEVLESFVLAHPEQWFWFHRRWKDELEPRRPG